MMRLTVAVGLVLLVGSCRGFGGLFNRFNPTQLANLGYGGNYYSLYTDTKNNHAEVREDHIVIICIF